MSNMTYNFTKAKCNKAENGEKTSLNKLDDVELWLSSELAIAPLVFVYKTSKFYIKKLQISMLRRNKIP